MASDTTGLPPMIEDASWDVKSVSEVKDHLIGTPQALEYSAAVAAGERSPETVQNDWEADDTGLISTAGIYSASKFHNAGLF